MAHALRGTAAGQDPRFGDKLKKQLSAIGAHAPKEYDTKIDMSKVNKGIMFGWISSRITELLGVEDEVLAGLVKNYLDMPNPDPRELQLTLTGFLSKNAQPFVVELWSMLATAQTNQHGIPVSMLEAKKRELENIELAAARAAAALRVTAAVAPMPAPVAYALPSIVQAVPAASPVVAPVVPVTAPAVTAPVPTFPMAVPAPPPVAARAVSDADEANSTSGIVFLSRAGVSANTRATVPRERDVESRRRSPSPYDRRRRRSPSPYDRRDRRERRYRDERDEDEYRRPSSRREHGSVRRRSPTPERGDNRRSRSRSPRRYERSRDAARDSRRRDASRSPPQRRADRRRSPSHERERERERSDRSRGVSDRSSRRSASPRRRARADSDDLMADERAPSLPATTSEQPEGSSSVSKLAEAKAKLAAWRQRQHSDGAPASPPSRS